MVATKNNPDGRLEFGWILCCSDSRRDSRP